MKRLIITGTGRSGTGYMAALFSAMGISCGHERVYRVGWPVLWQDYQVESSWLAVPISTKFPKVLILRDPIAFVNSYNSLRFTPEDVSYEEYSEEFVPIIAAEKTYQDRLLSFWVHWNIIGKSVASLTYWIDRFGAEDCCEIARLIDVNISIEDATTALNSTPRNINSKSHAKRISPEIGWSDFRPALAELAQDLYHLWREER